MGNRSLNFKMTLVMALFAAGAVTVAVMGVVKLNSLNESLNYLVETVSERVRYSVRLDANSNALKDLEKTMILEDNPQEMAALKKQLEAQILELKENLKGLRAVGLAKMDRLDLLEDRFAQWEAVDQEIQELALKGENQKAFRLADSKGKELINSFDAALNEVVDTNQKEMEAETKRTDDVYEQAKRTMIFVSCFAILIAGLLGYFILRAVNKAINRVIEELSNNSEQVSVAARQISESSQELSQAATEQASSLEETSSAVEEISSMVRRNAENANSSAQASMQGQKSCEKGKEVIGKMIRSMDEINHANDSVMNQVNESNQKISEIVDVIHEMGEKTKVINDIVFQTKLLSFNASVEAARAGEHGKGFAVVAEEVGNLAQMSGKAATEISEMLEGSIKRVEIAIQESKEKINTIILQGKGKVEEGSAIARECGDVLDEIVQSSAQINEMVRSIATASEEQSDGIAQITTAMSQLDQVTQTNASTSEEAASASEELSGQADQLKEVVALLVQSIKGDAGAVNRPVAHKWKPKKIKSEQAEDKKVVQLRPKEREQGRPFAPVAKVSGFGGVPSEDDPRFKEI